MHRLELWWVAESNADVWLLLVAAARSIFARSAQAIQAFLAYPNLKKVIGVELVTARFENGVAALQCLHKLVADSTLTETLKAVTLTTKTGRSIEFRHDNLLNVRQIALRAALQTRCPFGLTCSVCAVR